MLLQKLKHKNQVELELLFVSPSDDMPSTMPSTALNGIANSEAESEQQNGSVETTTTECQTDKVEKHVTFEDAIR